MKFLFLFGLIGISCAIPLPEADPEPKAYAADYAYYLPSQYNYQVPVVPAASPVVSSQYHAQDEAGQYNYGFQSADQTKTEVKTADGVVRGAYSYVDANGLVQTVNYISDALGFRVAATNLPVHEVAAEAAIPAAVEPEVYNTAAVPVEHSEHLVATTEVHGAAAPSVISAQVPYTYLPYAVNYGYNGWVQPGPVTAAAYAVPSAPVAAQYHAQDEAGAYSFGYNDFNSERHETKSVDGVVTGAYSYVDTDGKLQTVNYIADAAGFRVAGTNVPIHDVQPAVYGPVSVVDTPEVAAAKQQHALLYNAALAQAAEAAAAVEPANVEAAPYGALKTVDEPAVAVSAAPVAVASAPVAVAAVPVAVSPVAASQYHAQDETGSQYTYGYNDGNSVKQEIKTADGVVRGTYSYVDSNGLVQTVNYISDALGFRVGATNLPVHVVAEPAEQVAVASPASAAVAYSHPVIAPQVAYSYLPYASNYAYNTLPVAYTAQPAAETVVEQQSPVAIPIVEAAPALTSSQYHAQDEFGQYSYGFNSDTQAKSEVKTADGVTRGSYSYLDANGIVQTVNYLSDAMGFRVAATNLPIHQVEAVEAAPVPEVASNVVAETPEVASYSVAPTPEVVSYAVLTPQVANYAYLPYAQGYAYNQLVGAY